MLARSAFYLLLRSVKLSQGDDRLVAVRYVVFRQLSVILQCAFCEMVLPVGLLQEQIARVGIRRMRITLLLHQVLPFRERMPRSLSIFIIAVMPIPSR